MSRQAPGHRARFGTRAAWAAATLLSSLGIAAKPPSVAVAAEPSHKLLFDRIVAWVDGETISQNELFAEASLARVAAEGEAAVRLPLAEADLERHLRRLIGDMLIAREARRVGATAIEAEEADHAFATLLDNFSSTEAYHSYIRALGVDDSFVLDSIRRRLLCDRYLSQRLRTRLMQDRLKPMGGPDGHTPPVRDRSREERYQALVAAYRQELWRTVPVRMLRPHGGLERITTPVP